jgi:hypothetical protein
MGRLTALCLVLALAGCGGGGNREGSSGAEEAKLGANGDASQARPGSPPQSGPTSATQPSSGTPRSSSQAKRHNGSSGGSGQLTSQGADNSVEEFGAEAKGGEFEAAAASLHRLLDARAQRNWVAACEYLSTAAKTGLAELSIQVPQLKGKGCPIQVSALTESISSTALHEAAIADVASVRVRGDHGVVIYRGARDQIEAITMAREGREWKVAALSAVPLG